MNARNEHDFKTKDENSGSEDDIYTTNMKKTRSRSRFFIREETDHSSEPQTSESTTEVSISHNTGIKG